MGHHCSGGPCFKYILKAELGAMSRHFQNEDGWLRGVRDHLGEIIEDPDEYVDYWNLEEAEDLSATMIEECSGELYSRVNEILATSLSNRGRREW
jgi:hypothetical protein